MSRDQWKTVTLEGATFATDPRNFYLDTTGGFYTNALSTSVSRMPRMVNAVPETQNGVTYWHKRIGFETLYSTYSGGLSEWYITEDGSTTYGFANASAPYTSSLPTWSGSSTDPTAFYRKCPTERYIGTVLYILTTANETDNAYVVTSTTDKTTAGFFIPSNAKNGTRTGTLTSGAATITGLSSTSDLYVGQHVSNAHFATTGYTYIISIDSASQVTVGDNSDATVTENVTFSYSCRILDADFPGNVVGKAVVGKMVTVDGYTFVMEKNGDIWNSDLNSITAWTSTGFLNAQQWTDGSGAGLIKYKNTVMACGSSSIEFFRNAGNATGSPLQRIEELGIHLSCPFSDQICEGNDTVYFLGAGLASEVGVYQMEGFQPKKLSTPEIDSILLTPPSYGNSTWGISAFNYRGKRCLGVTEMFGVAATGIANKAQHTTLIYFLDENKWAEWRAPESKLTCWAGGYFRNAGSTNSSYAEPDLFAINLWTGQAFQMIQDVPVYKDHDGTVTQNTFNYFLQTPPLSFGTEKRKACYGMRLMDHTGTTFTPSTGLTVYWSDDFGVTWVTRAGLSTQEDFTGLGTFRKRIFRFVENSANPYSLGGVEFDLQFRNS